jgi:mono/diheme cytochrome c family protein
VNHHPRTSWIAAGVLAAAAAGSVPRTWALPQSADAPVAVESGESLFKTYCATCHGDGAKGDGRLAGQLRMRPADLTLMAKHEKGKFDAEKAARIIDGRNPVKGHGGADMPVWGDAFRNTSDRYNEEAVKTRIKALVDYLETLQEK